MRTIASLTNSSAVGTAMTPPSWPAPTTTSSACLTDPAAKRSLMRPRKKSQNLKPFSNQERYVMNLWKKREVCSNNEIFDLCILHFDLKETTFKFNYFMTISGHYFANHISIFQNFVADGHFEVQAVLCLHGSLTKRFSK